MLAKKMMKIMTNKIGRSSQSQICLAQRRKPGEDSED